MRKLLKLNFALFTVLFAARALAGTGANADEAEGVVVAERAPTTRIAYVCDSSGSMLGMFEQLRLEIRKSVEHLKAAQSFNVIFWQETGFHALDDKALIPATPENKRLCVDFLDKMFVKGETNPIPALDLAFKQEAEQIYLFTDGDFGDPGNDAVVKFCQEKTKDGKTKINTIGFISKDSREKPEDMEFVKAMKAIAKNSGGKFRLVTEDDMGK